MGIIQKQEQDLEGTPLSASLTSRGCESVAHPLVLSPLSSHVKVNTTGSLFS